MVQTSGLLPFISSEINISEKVNILMISFNIIIITNSFFKHYLNTIIHF